MSGELQEIADTLADIDSQLKALEQAANPAPRTGTLVYLSGRWKLRDGGMYGR